MQNGSFFCFLLSNYFKRNYLFKMNMNINIGKVSFSRDDKKVNINICILYIKMYSIYL